MIEIFNLKLKINVGRGTILIEKKQSNNRMEKAMKTITKIIHINDGNDVTAHNGVRLFV